MTRTFAHEFEPSHLNSIGSQVALTSAEIEQAGILEVLQTPGALLMSGALLESLLSQTSSEFLFAQHLGRAREVKVALSGLLGRFVARAYLRWSPPAGQSGGLDKLGSGCHQAANFSIPGAQYMSSGVPPASIEWGRREL